MSLQSSPMSQSESDPPQGLAELLTGYHRICLERPYRLDYASQSFLGFLGYSAEELQRFDGDYSLMVYEPDREKFRQFLDALAETEQSLILWYRLQKNDGTLIHICDTSNSRRLEDGRMYAFSVISSAPYRPGAYAPGDPISVILPYGYLRCTCEKDPKVIYVNQALCDYLNISRENDAWRQAARENIYFMLPFDEREQFRQYVDQAMNSDRSIRITHHMFRSDGSRCLLTGWISRIINEYGEQEFAVIYRQLEEGLPQLEPIQETSYFPVLKRAYNALFEVDLLTSTVKCIHGLEESPVGPLCGIQMTTESALNLCLNNYIFPEDRAMMDDYFHQVCIPQDNWNGKNVLQADFRIKFSGQIYQFVCIAVHLNTNQVLLCCRNMTNQIYSGVQRLESKILHTIYDWLDYLSANAEGTIGFLMLDKTKEDCYLLYGSASVIHYLGMDTNGNAHRARMPSLAECLSAAELTREEFDEMVAGKPLYLWSRSAPDAFQFQLTCKSYTNGDRTLYLIWCSVIDLQLEPTSKRVFARTFGHFDLFIDDKPIIFSNAKEKELMALLIDRYGGTLSPSEAISYLWEDAVDDEHTSARYRKLAMGLKRTLEKYGIADIVINHNGIRSIDTSAIHCDYYELLAGNAKYSRAFHGSYMTDYSWGEETLATLYNYQ